ncbi:DNA circularization protein, partial [Neisseria sp. P0015.S009]
IPDNLLTGRVSDGLQSRLNRLTAKQVQPVAQAVRLLSTASLLSVATALIEAHGEEMTAPDLIEVNRAMRRRMQAEIAALRAVQTAAAGSGTLTANAVYTEAYQTAESLRAAAGRLNARRAKPNGGCS